MLITIILITIMGLFVSSIINKKKENQDFQSIIKSGGIKEKYSVLINLIEKLSEETFITRDSSLQVIELNHLCRSFGKTINTYCIEISFKRQGQVFNSKDLFTLKALSDGSLEIIYFRKTEHLIPQVSKVLPKELSKKFKFSYIHSQERIFKQLLENINIMYKNKYNFSDLHFQSVLEDIKS